ncbi:DUF6285 domain-containing protein [Paraburkholderia unamae]|uniref:DUF6285 domain-containing protein n=1 Tax=Paraburkholderia unamae TaxID=219649 RepID=A0ABX5KL66_9BURK|nr:DUF6285 domain-containing protein [Paraburkholderia unamae]PVX82759.1 hypothetical protein C7402_108132 [Paraburkholderia unamae]RAR61306.1 hypothetical protein C7401_108242 [Paraburkholderia unamae]CAG9269380.1 conserved hypothetical protein [Paraburkholderia unamae]
MNTHDRMVDLLDTATGTLTGDVLPSLQKEARYNGLMVANAMRIVARHFGRASAVPDAHAPVQLLGDAVIVSGIRAGQFDVGSPMRPALVATLWNRLAQELAVDNPRMLETLQNSPRGR